MIVTASIVGFFVLVCGGFAGCSVLGNTVFREDTGGNPARSDVSLSGCRASGAGTYHATLTVKNSTTKTADYTVSIEWRSGGARVADDTEHINNVPAGGTVVEEAASFGPERNSATCTYQVTRR